MPDKDVVMATSIVLALRLIPPCGLLLVAISFCYQLVAVTRAFSRRYSLDWVPREIPSLSAKRQRPRQGRFCLALSGSISTMSSPHIAQEDWRRAFFQPFGVTAKPRAVPARIGIGEGLVPRAGHDCNNGSAASCAITALISAS